MAEITLEVSPFAQALQRHCVPALRRIVVEEMDGTVVLFGTVPNYYLKQLAQEAVLPLLRGRRLLNRIDVVRD